MERKQVSDRHTFLLESESCPSLSARLVSEEDNGESEDGNSSVSASASTSASATATATASATATAAAAAARGGDVDKSDEDGADEEEYMQRIADGVARL